ncbi:MAG: beta-class carbonic anhydrase [Deltaproteobacteria bacterium]
MSEILDKVLRANAEYAAGLKRKKGSAHQGYRFAVLTCMDARLDPVKFAGLAEGEAYVIRNAGGRASDDAIRSLVISYKLLGTIEWFVIHHTGCGMQMFSNDIMAGLLASSLKPAIREGHSWRDSGEGEGSDYGGRIDWMTFTDNERSVTDDVLRIRNHPLVPGYIPIYGFIYDTETGALREVPEAMQAGRIRE